MKINKKSILFISIILCFSFMCMCLSACTWEDFKNKAKDVWDNLVAVDDNGNDMLNGETYEMPSAMTFRSSAPNTTKTVTLTATVEPSTAANKNLDWSLAWKNAGTAWATGKTVTSYVTVTPTSDGANTASVKYLADFGEQIILTVKSRVNENASATCTIDCLQAVSFKQLVYPYGEETSNDDWVFKKNADPIDFPGVLLHDVCETADVADYMKPVIEFNYGSTFTKARQMREYRMYVTLSNDLATKLYNSTSTALKSYFNENCFNEKEVLATSYVPSENSSLSNFISIIDIYSVLFNRFCNPGNPQVIYTTGAYNEFCDILRSVSGDHFTMKLVIDYDYLGYSETVSFGMRFSDSSIGLVAESVSLSSTALNF